MNVIVNAKCQTHRFQRNSDALLQLGQSLPFFIENIKAKLNFFVDVDVNFNLPKIHLVKSVALAFTKFSENERDFF